MRMKMREAKSKAEATFLKSYPKSNIEWKEKMRLVTYPTGYKGFRGSFTASCEGYRTRLMYASVSDSGCRVY